MTKIESSAKAVPFAFVWPLKIAALGNMAATSTAMWMVQNRASYPAVILRGASIAVGIVIAALTLSIVSRSAGIFAVSVIMQAGGALVVIAFIAIIFMMTHGTWKALQYRALSTPPNPASALPEAVDTWQPPDISPDILVCLLPGDIKATFIRRANDIRMSDAISNAIWAVVLFPNSAEAIIITDGDPYIFTRGNEPFLEQPAVWAGKVDHRNEDAEAYRRYVAWFCQHYAAWVTGQKISLAPKSAFSILSTNMAQRPAIAKATQNQ